MTGHLKNGKLVHQKEKLYALLRSSQDGLTVYELTSLCWKSLDSVLTHIKSPTIRRCLQELRDCTPSLVKKNELTEKWKGFEKEI